VNLRSRLDAKLLDIMSGIGVPPRHLDKIAAPEESSAAEAVDVTGNSKDGWQMRGFLVLTGVPGVGKSFGAALAIKKYLLATIGDWFETANWEHAVKAAESVSWYSAKEITGDKNIASRMRTCRLAVIDDLGKEDDSRISLPVVRDVISKRYDLKLPTVITSELTLPDIRARYGQYIAERLAEDYCSKIINCVGESFRLKEALSL
jgi:DNA replication protein DnaC